MIRLFPWSLKIRSTRTQSILKRLLPAAIQDRRSPPSEISGECGVVTTWLNEEEP